MLSRSGVLCAWLEALPALEWEARRGASQEAHERELTALVLRADAQLLLYNLFCLEAQHLAEARHVPSVALAPYAMPHAMPAGLIAWLHDAAPERAAALACAAPGGGACWCSMVLWQYPLLNAARWQRLRAALALPPLTPLSPAPRLLFGMSAALLPGEGGGSLAAQLARLCPRAARQVHITGSWHEARAGGVVPTPAPRAAPAVPLVAATWGSMVSLGAVGPDEELPRILRILHDAAERAGVRVVVLVPSGLPGGMGAVVLAGGGSVEVWRRPAAAAARADDGSDAGSEGWGEFAAWAWALPRDGSVAAPPPPGISFRAAPLALLAGDIPHAALLPHCDAVLHHGGAGTTAAVARAGVPHVCMPIIFDQPLWGHAVARAGVAPAPRPLWGILDAPHDEAVAVLAGDLAAAVDPAGPLRAAATALAAGLAAEADGAGAAAVLALEHVQGWGI